MNVRHFDKSELALIITSPDFYSLATKAFSLLRLPRLLWVASGSEYHRFCGLTRFLKRPQKALKWL
jgi:hypothetical protein